MSTVRLPGLLPTGTGRIPLSSWLTRTQHSGQSGRGVTDANLRPLEPHCGAFFLQGKPAENMDDKATVYPAAALQRILCFFTCSTAFHTTHWMEYW